MKTIKEMWPAVWRLGILYLCCYFFVNGHNVVDKMLGGVVGLFAGSTVVIIIES